MGTLALLKKCESFATKTTQVAIVDNTEPFLVELTKRSKKSFDDAIEFCDEHCEKKLGEGSSRTAYALNENFLLKIAHNEKGLSQCLVESQLANQRSCVNSPIVADPEGRWLLFHMTEKLTKSDFEELTGFTFADFTNSLFYKFNQESDWKKPKKYDEIVQSDLYQCVADLVEKADTLIGDLAKISSWGLKDEKPVLVDTGLDRQTYDKWYDHSSSKSPKSSS